MKILSAIFCVLLLVGCASSQQSASLTPDQASTLAIRLANDRAATVYQCQPFRDGQPAHLVAGHWVWAGQQGFGRGDLQATVELAADGSTNNVDLLLFDSHDFRPF
jgi:hypothetical protein